MSGAFVKESDGDTPEELPELPLSEHRNYVTPRGLAQLRTRLAVAQERAREAAGDAIGAMPERRHAERDIRWLQARIASAVPVDPSTHPRDRVAFGASVEVADPHGVSHVYRIVGEDEADPEHGLVSWVSPLARALNGAQVGEEVLWHRPIGDVPIEVTAIGYDEPADLRAP